MNIVDIAAFYTQTLGKATQDLLAAKLTLGLVAGPEQLVLGLGYASPYLGGVPRSLSFMLARGGVMHWPLQGPVRSALVDELDLPLPDNSMDIAVLVHALEFSESAEDLLQEVWRVLAPQAKLLLVVPNRRGLWAASEASPFGQGQPFSRGQILRHLREAQFLVSRIEQCLFAPPWAGAGMVKGLERAAQLGLRHFGGVFVIEATKQVHAYASGRLVRRALPRLRPMLLPGAQPIGKI